MTLTKVWLDLIPTETDEYAIAVSKEKSDIASYCVEGFINISCMSYTSDMISILSILRSEVKEPTIQPTPIFYFTESNTCAINVWRILSNRASSSPFGMSHIACLAPIRFTEQPDANTFAQITIDGTPIYLSIAVNINDVLANTMGITPDQTIDMPNSPVTKTISFQVNLGVNSNIGSFVVSSTGIGLVKHIKSTNKYSIPTGAVTTRLVNSQSLQQENTTTQITSTKYYAGINAKRIGLLCDSKMVSSQPTFYQNYTDPDTNYNPDSISISTIFPVTAPSQRIFLVAHLPVDQQNNALSQVDNTTITYGSFYMYTNILDALTIVYPYIEFPNILLHGAYDTYLHTIQEGHWHRTTRQTSYKVKARAGIIAYKRDDNDTPLEIRGYSIYINNFTTYKVGIILNVKFGDTFAKPAALQYSLQYEYEDGTMDVGTVSTINTSKNQGGYLVLSDTGTELAAAPLASYQSSVDALNDGGNINPINSLTPFPNFENSGYTPIPSNGKKIIRVTFYLPEGIALPPADSDTNYLPNLLVVLSPKT
ncbi:MAG: hypothetical protein ACRCX2_07945 [Paraclostridium sp.]